MSDKNEMDLTKVDLSNLTVVWERIGLLVKYLAGDVKLNTDGTLQDQIDAVKKDIPTVDTALSNTSTNPVQNKVVKAFLDSIISGTKTVGLASTLLSNNTFTKDETIESWVLATNNFAIKFSVSGAIPTDSPLDAEGFYVLFAQGWSRKKVMFIPYGTDNGIYERWMFNNEWRRGWAKSIIGVAETLSGLIASVAELNYMTGAKSKIQDQLDDIVNGITTTKNAERAIGMRTYSIDGGIHGEDNWILKAQWQRKLDGCFELFVANNPNDESAGEYKVSVDTADKAKTLNGYNHNNFVKTTGDNKINGSLEVTNHITVSYPQYLATRHIEGVGGQLYLNYNNPTFDAICVSNGVSGHILHTGNSNKINISSVAPSDTSALWAN